MLNYYNTSHYNYLNNKPICGLFTEVIQIP